MKKWSWYISIILILGLIGGGIWVAFVKFEWEKPSIQLLTDNQYVGQKISFLVEDKKSGVAEVTFEAIQLGKSVKLLAEQFPKGTHRVEKTVILKPLPQGLKDGEVQIKIAARDYSWNRGNPVFLEKGFILDTHPPLVSVFGGQHYVNQGGTGLVTYQVSEEAPGAGVQVGDNFFPGYATSKNHYLTYFAVPLQANSATPISVAAEDRAGNKTQSGFRPMIKNKSFKKDQIQITDNFLNNIIPYFKEQDPNLQGSPVDIFLTVNKKQRDIDHQQITKLCQNSAGQPLWAGVFVRLPNSKPMASFGEDRTYIYNGKEIDRQTHLGIDLASVAQSPVLAANAGKVVFAGPLGIYGNTVLIDHGCGLFSMYSHLSRIETEVNKAVRKEESLGRTGATGMAGGDHLHFSMLVHGIFVNPIEWLDPHWIQDNVEKKMKMSS
jgi:murein DD-endopeptidase MepM/ murein hydrolase activator NlpD